MIVNDLTIFYYILYLITRRQKRNLKECILVWPLSLHSMTSSKNTPKRRLWMRPRKVSRDWRKGGRQRFRHSLPGSGASWWVKINAKNPRWQINTNWLVKRDLYINAFLASLSTSLSTGHSTSHSTSRSTSRSVQSAHKNNSQGAGTGFLWKKISLKRIFFYLHPTSQQSYIMSVHWITYCLCLPT